MVKQRIIKLIREIGRPALDLIDDIPVFLQEPFSTEEVNMLLNPDIPESKDISMLKGIQGGRVTMLGQRKEKTMPLKFDFKNNRSHKVMLNEKPYLMKLNKIENIKDGPKEIMTYEFILVKL